MSQVSSSGKRASNWCWKGVRPKFTVSEDQRLGQLVAKYGKKSWVTIAKKMTNKTPKQCRERYENYVNPRISNSEWTPEEEQLLIEKYNEIGPHWVKLTKFFKARSVNNIRNKWLMLKRKNLISNFPQISPPNVEIEDTQNSLFTNKIDSANDKTVVISMDPRDSQQNEKNHADLVFPSTNLIQVHKVDPNIASINGAPIFDNTKDKLFNSIDTEISEFSIFNSANSDIDIAMQSFYALW